jgi:diaminopimelate decarboxylase
VTCLALQLAFDTECRILAGQFAFVVCFAQFASAVLEALQFLAAADICLARASPEASLALEAADIERKDMILMKAVYSDPVKKHSQLNGIPPK